MHFKLLILIDTDSAIVDLIESELVWMIIIISWGSCNFEIFMILYNALILFCNRIYSVFKKQSGENMILVLKQLELD